MVAVLSVNRQIETAAETDSAGRFDLNGLAGGTYVVRALVVGYDSLRDTVRLSGAGGLRGVIRLEKTTTPAICCARGDADPSFGCT